jgi:hypothetical protein
MSTPAYRPTRPKALALALTAAGATIAFAAAMPGAAAAAASSQTVALGSANPIGGAPLFASDGHTRAGGVSNDAQASAGPFSTQVEADAGFDVGSGPSQFPAVWGVGYFGDLAFPGDPGHSDLNAFATVSTLDRLTLAGLADDHRAVTLHASLELRDVPGFQGFADIATDQSHEDFHAEAHSNLRIDGTGIGLSELGSDVFASRDIVADPHHQSFGNFVSSSPFVDATLHMTVGQGLDFGLNLTEAATFTGDDPSGNLVGDLFSGDGASLTWEGFFVTDDRTGQFVCGLTLNADSGINFGAAEGCAGGGGGGGGGGGSGGVPEPSAWALMIAGFGLAGARLRRRRMLSAS